MIGTGRRGGNAAQRTAVVTDLAAPWSEHARRREARFAEMRDRDRGVMVVELGERRLVARMLRGDEAAFDEFADAYLPRLHRYATSRLRGDRELVRDVVQATACKAIEKLSTFRGESPLFTWLCACCRNEIASHFRRRHRRPVEVGLEDAPLAQARPPLHGAAPPDAEDRLLLDEQRELVHLALDRLPTHYALALEAKYLERRPVREIAERLELSEKAAESLLTRARAAFRDAWREIGDEDPANGSAPTGGEGVDR